MIFLKLLLLQVLDCQLGRKPMKFADDLQSLLPDLEPKLQHGEEREFGWLRPVLELLYSDLGAPGSKFQFLFEFGLLNL
jgi:hypothetical protein